jgi:hypothetical protein
MEVKLNSFWGPTCRKSKDSYTQILLKICRSLISSTVYIYHNLLLIVFLAPFCKSTVI